MRRIAEWRGSAAPTPASRRLRPSGLAALCLAVLLLLPVRVAAQEGVVAGTVVTEQSLRPVAGAQVVIDGTGQGTLTDANGRFRFTGLTGPEIRLRVVMIGYRTTTETARVGNTGVRISLRESAIELDEVVVTGTVGATQRRAVGNVVSRIDADEVVATAPVANIQELINGRAAGVVIMPGTGMVGGGAKIRVRGLSSLSLSGEPLIYVDGVRVNNAQSTGPTNQGFGSNVVSRWNDFNPEDIESIEIIKGPAAATLYGTEAANGVIQIITKKGAQGAPRVSLTVKQGAKWFANAEERIYTNWGKNPETGQIESINMVALERERGNEIFRTGHMQEYDLSVSGGLGLFRYYLGGGLERDEGVEPNNSVNRYSGRVNLAVAPREDVDVEASLGYTSGRTNLSVESGGGGVTWSTYFASPTRLGTPRRGFWSGTPEAYYRHYQDWQDVRRFTGSVQANHRPFGWLAHRLAIGTDQTLEDNVELVERNDDLRFFFGSETRGYRDQTRRGVSFNTVDYSATATLQVRPQLSSSTSVGAQYYQRYSEFVSAYGEDFPAPGLRAIDAAAVQRGNHDYAENSTVGVFVQEQLGWRDRLFLTAGVRADDNSAFGENFDLVYYPKASASWIITEEPFWRFGWVNALKLRAAYGESGLQPESFAALRTFEPVAGPGDVGTVTPQLLGNPSLGPERGREVELGFDAGFLDDRVGIEFTYYNQRTRDAILLRDIAPSTGFSGSQYINAGEVSNRGIEILARVEPVRTDRAVWDLSVTLATNENEVLSLGDPDLDYVSAGSFIRHQVGFPVGSWFGQRLVAAELDAAGKAIAGSLMCDGGPENNGQVVPCADAPEVYLGRNTPKYEGAVTNSVTLFDRLRINALVDFKYGQSKLDGNRRVRCWFFSLCRQSHFPLEADAVDVAGAQQRFPSDIIEDAGFAKLREVSATYTLADDLARRFGASRFAITVAGRNLYTWTDYPGLEPEAMFLGGSRGYGSWEQNVIPQLNQFVVSANVAF